MSYDVKTQVPINLLGVCVNITLTGHTFYLSESGVYPRASAVCAAAYAFFSAESSVLGDVVTMYTPAKTSTEAASFAHEKSS